MKKNYFLSILILLSGLGSLSQLTAPFTETFSSTSSVPSTWTTSTLAGGTGGPWRVGGTMGYAASTITNRNAGTPGSSRLWIDHSGNDNGVAITSDVINVSGLTTPELNFYFNNNLGTNTLNPLNILIVEAFNGSSWISIDTLNQNNMGMWTEHFYDMSTYVYGGSNLQVRFVTYSGGASVTGGVGSDFYFDLAIDDISVVEFSPCRPVISLNTTAITSSSATAGWMTATGADTAWIVEYGPSGFTPGTGTTAQVSTNSYTISGLSPATLYDFYVTGLCNTGDTSAQVGPETFQTACLAGLSGTYTIDPASPTAGTNFNSFADFFATVLNCGLDAATIVNVDSVGGPYVMNVDVPFIPGSSLSNTLTLNGNGSIINHGGGSYFVAFNGVKNLTINEFNFVNETPTTQKFGVMMRGGCDSITFTKNTFDMGITSTSSASGCIIASNSLTSVFTNGNNADNVTVDSNIFKGTYVGVVLRGPSTSVGMRAKGHKIINNVFEDQSVYGIYTFACDSILIDNNNITRTNRTNSSSYYGIYNWYSASSIITNNKIHNVRRASTCYPMYLGYLNNSATSPGFVVNNAVYDIENTSTFYGIYLYSFSTATTTGNNHINIWHNTVTKNTSGSTSTTRGISVNTTTATYIDNIDLTNNIVDIYGSGSGTKYAVYFPNVANFSGSNNVLYNGATAGSNNLGYFGSNQATLAAWNTASGQTGNSDANPIIIAPGYTPFSTVIDNFGTPLPLVPTDIDGATRSTTTPDPGVVEYIPSGGDILLTNAGLAQVDNCYGTADTAFVDLTNLFGDTLDFVTNPVTVYFEVTGPINTTTSTVLNTDSLLVGDVIRVINSTIDMSVPGKYSLKTYIDFSVQNVLSLNDTVEVIDASEVKQIILTTPEFDTLYSYSDSAKLSTQSPFYPGGAFFITEVNQFRTGTGSPTGGWPSYFTSDDYIEITGVPGSDLAGYTIEFWTTSLARSYTFPAGTIVGPNGTLIFGHGNATSSPANFYYGMSPTWTSSSGSPSGRVIKDASGNIVDAVGYQGSSSYTFPAASGVTTSDWSGSIAGSVSGTSGIRLEGPDLNGPTGWVSSATSPQDPNTLNTGVPIPAPTSVSGLTWTDLTSMTVIDTTPEIYAKGFTANGTYPIEAAFVTPCGTFRDTSYITVLNITYDTTIINECDSFQLPLSGRINYATGFDTDTLKSTSAPIYDSIYFVYDINIDTTNETITLVECDSFVSPSGKVWNTTGTYFDTITNSLGCDSLMVFNLTVNYANTGMTTVTACDTFIAPSGAVFRATGTYMDTIMNSSGCDSVITVNLTILNSTFATVTATVCDSFVSPTTGTVWTSTGTYNDTIINSIGCDSITIYNITVNYSTSRTDNITLCPGQTYRVGPSVYSSAGTYTDIFSTIHGCDSIIITNLSYYAPAVATVNYNFCIGDSVQVLGNWYYSATVVMDTIVAGSSNGCDSITTHNITTRTVTPALNLGTDVVACLDGGATIFASTAYDTYQWSNGGTTNVLSTTGAASGVGSTDYILTVTQASSGCTARDTVNITYNNCTGLDEVDADLNVNLYPNPASDYVTIEIFDRLNQGNLKLEILNSVGQVVVSQSIESTNGRVIMDVNRFSKGLYLVRVSSDRIYMTKKLLIQK